MSCSKHPPTFLSPSIHSSHPLVYQLSAHQIWFEAVKLCIVQLKKILTLWSWDIKPSFRKAICPVIVHRHRHLLALSFGSIRVPHEPFPPLTKNFYFDCEKKSWNNSHINTLIKYCLSSDSILCIQQKVFIWSQIQTKWYLCSWIFFLNFTLSYILFHSFTKKNLGQI